MTKTTAVGYQLTGESKVETYDTSGLPDHTGAETPAKSVYSLQIEPHHVSKLFGKVVNIINRFNRQAGFFFFSIKNTDILL